MKKINKYYILFFLFTYLLLEELIFSFLTYKNITIELILFSFLYSFIIYFIYLITNKKSILYLLNILIFLIFISNYLYFINYLSFIKINVMIKSVKVLYFSNNIIEIIKNNIIGLLLLFIPLIVVCYLIKEDNYKNKFKFNIKYIITLLILYVLPIISLFITNNNDIYSKSSLYFDINFPIKNLSSFGLITSLRLDTQRYIFKFKDKGSFININNCLI